MEDILVFQHDPLEGLGTFAEVLHRRNLSCRYVRLFAGEQPSKEWGKAKAVIVLGGPMSVHEEEKYPFLKWEKVIIKGTIDSGVPLLGTCLGAQLIAAATGAEVYRGTIKEIGWYPISLTLEGQFDPLFGRLLDKITVFQWHGDGFELPAGAQRLASSAHYNNEAFRIGRNIYGLQFHLEVTSSMIEQWMHRHGTELARLMYIAPDKIRVDTRSYAQNLRHCGERFFLEFLHRVSLIKSPGKRLYWT